MIEPKPLHGAAVLLSIIAIFGGLIWAGTVLATYSPNRKDFVPVLIFDSTEPCFPTKINFDNTWRTDDSREHYNKDTAPLALYYRVLRKDTYFVYQYFPWYASNEYINFHEVDPEQGAYVWVRDNRPFAYAISYHGKWKVIDVSRVEQLYAYVQRGSHGLYYTMHEAFPNDSNLPIAPDNFELIKVEDAMEHEGEFTDSLGYFLTNEPGDLTKPWWYFPWFNNPDMLLDNYPTLKAKLVQENAVELSVVGNLPSLSSFLVSGSLIALVAFLLGLALAHNGMTVITIFSALVMVGVIAGSYLTYSPEQLPLSAAVVAVRVIPFAFLAIAAAGTGYLTRMIYLAAIGGKG